MSSFIKPLAALAVSFLFFAGFVYVTDNELLDLIQTRFYNPSVVNSYVNENKIDSEIAQNHIIKLQDEFAQTLTEHAVRSSFLYNQSADDIFQRSRIFGTLIESINALQSVQFVDANGLRIHYSTSSRDIYSQNRASTSYRNYNESSMVLPYETVSVPDGSSPGITMDDKSDRIIFSFPFYDSMDVYRGTALFYVGARAIAEKLIAEGRLKIGDNVSVIAEPAGILLGSPEVSKDDINKVVAQAWRDGIQERVTLDSGGSGINYSLITVKTAPAQHDGIYFGRLINDYLFSISEPMKLILNLSIFLTFFLTFFFLINLKPNPPAVVRNRLKRLKDSLFEQLYVNKSSQERSRWILELEQRRDEIRKELKHNLKLSSRQEAAINSIIDKSWDELLAVIKAGSGVIVQTKVVEAKQSIKVGADSDIDDIEEIEEIEEAEAVEETGGIESVDKVQKFDAAKEVGEIEKIEEAEDLEEIEEIEEVEEIEDLEEIEEAGEVTNIIDVALREAIVPVQPYSVGLLRAATRFLSRKGHLGHGKGLLKKASEKKFAAGKGLLAKAAIIAATKVAEKGKEIKTSGKPRKGLLALASEIEINPEYSVDDEAQDLIADLDIVSPFSSMFSSLDNFSNDDFPRT